MPLVAQILREWADQFARKKEGRGAVFAECRRRGVAPDSARELAREAVQEAVARVLAKYGESPERYAGGYAHFRHSVTLTAINYARSVLRRRREDHIPDGMEPLAVVSDPRLAAICHCRDLLPERQRALLQLKWEEDCTLDEMADQLLSSGAGSANARRLRIRREYRDALGAMAACLQFHYPELNWESTTEWTEHL